MKFFIHVGPPKTGTSAIQKWCTSNSRLLIENGVYYPVHDVDRNGVSSGNLSSIFDVNEEGGYEFSPAKHELLIEKAQDRGVTSILLSSEFFFKEISILAEVIVNVQFIAYVRFELDLIESGYNQSIKRHGHSKILHVPTKVGNNNLHILDQTIEKVGEQFFLLRAYGSEAFSGGNIITDLLETIGVSVSNQSTFIESSKINSGYSLEGLELKRWFNQFGAEYLDPLLDNFLQKKAKEDDLDYSIMPGSGYWKLKKMLVKQLISFCQRRQVFNGSILVNAAKDAKQSKVRIQHIGTKTFNGLLAEFLCFELSNITHLKRFYEENNFRSNSIEDQLKFSEIANLIKSVSANESYFTGRLGGIVNFLSPQSFKVHSSKSSKTGKVGSLAYNHAKSFLGLEKQSVLAVYQKIPWVEKYNVSATLESAFGCKAVYYVPSESTESESQATQMCFLPQHVKVVVGQFSSPDLRSFYFRNAKKFCWVRDPLERLWEQFNNILYYERPVALYNKLMLLVQKKQLVNKKYLFVAMMEDPSFDVINRTFSCYVDSLSLKNMDFVGSVHRLKADLPRLQKLISCNLQLYPQSEWESVLDLPKDLRKFESLLVEEYELVGPYL